MNSPTYSLFLLSRSILFMCCSIAPCSEPATPSNGWKRYHNLKHGHSVKFFCSAGYDRLGASSITCNDGTWDNQVPLCKARCSDPGSPIHGRKRGEIFRHNSWVQFLCDANYQLDGNQWIQCVDGSWSGTVPKCTAKSCRRPSEISNGRIVGYVYSFKEKIRYVCFEGFKLKGPSYRICQANEEWSGAKPICEAVNCGPLKKPDHGDIIEQVGFTFGERIVFKCTDRGYEMKGSRERRCQSDGTWSGSPTTCELVQCGDPGTPLNGTQNVDKGYVYGGSVMFICDKDYALQGTSKIYCRADKSWSASVPRCLAPCPDPGVPYQGIKIGQDFRHDHTVRFTCHRGYVMEGVSTIKCSDGKWSNNKPSCKAPCQEPVAPAHSWKRDRDFRHGRAVRFYCFGGYQRVGAASITCNDGKWNNRVPVCKGICGRPRTPSHGRVHGSSFLDGDEVTFSCDKNYDLFGNSKLRCVGQRWDSSLPECKARCRFLGRPLHGFYDKGMRKAGDMIKHGVQITYGCFRDYTLVGANMQECSNGRWTNDRPECKATCRSPGGIAHGIKIGSDYGHSKTVQYECDAEYTLEGQNTLTCDDGKWNSNLPICRASCGNPGVPLHGRKRGDNFRHKEWVQFRCDVNYQLDGDQWIQCVDGVWSGNLPKCIAVCPDPGVPAKGRRLDDDFMDGKTVRFVCNRNHDLLGNRTIKCIGGAWSANPPECKGRCAFKGNPNKGFTRNQNFLKGEHLAHNSNIEYACKVTYTLTGSNVLHCNDGKWNATVPSCKASCDDPGLIQNGRKAGNDFSHGQTVTYECLRGYSLEGSNHLTCNDGKWHSNRPACKASCSPLNASSNGNLHNNQTKHGTVVSFSCNSGFKLKGLRQIMCVDGKWNGSSPACKGSCKDPRPFKNGIVIGDDYSYGSSVEFRCNFTYRLHGSRKIYCVNGTWDANIPECRKPCQDPGRPQNGWALGNNYDHGSVVRFVCKNQTYDRIGASNITCKDGKWSDPTPSCEAKCNDPGKPENGGKMGDDYRSGSNVAFRCKPLFDLVGSQVINCKNGKWSDLKPTCSYCARPLGIENSNIRDFRITSPDSYPGHPSSNARLNGRSSWCTTRQTYLQIDLNSPYKVTAIATQGGTRLNKWVKKYTIGFFAGATLLVYNETGSQKTIKGNKDASSAVKYYFQEPFVTKRVRIYPVVDTFPVCLRMELYGCDPNPDCILVGSEVWGFWAFNHNSFNYYKANIIKLNATHIDFALQVNNRQTRSYKRSEPVLVIDKIPEMKDISVNSRVIAVHRTDWKEWYRNGTVTGTDGSSFVSVKFHDGQQRHWIPLNELRLVNRPRVCADRV